MLIMSRQETVLDSARLWAQAGIGSSARLTFTGLAGDLLVQVRRGCQVRTDGFVLFGDPMVDVVRGDGPEVTISSYSPSVT